MRENMEANNAYIFIYLGFRKLGFLSWTWAKIKLGQEYFYAQENYWVQEV